MSDPNNQGQQIQPTPETGSDREAMRVELRKMNQGLGKPEDHKPAETPKPEDEKPTDKTVPAPVKPENKPDDHKGHKGFDRRIGKLTARNKQLEEELARYKNQIKQPEKPNDEKKFTRESFKSDEEYWEYLAEKKAEQIYNKRIQESTTHNEQLIQQRQQEIEFEKEWKRKETTVFGGNNAALEEYRALVEEHHDTVLPQEVWDVINDSDISPFLLSVVLHDEELRERLTAMSPARRSFTMLELEKRVLASQKRQSTTTEQKPAVSNAPTPVGSVSANGVSKSGSELSQRERLQKREATRGF